MNIDVISSILGESSLLKYLSKSEIEHVLSFGKIIQYAKDDVILKQGDKSLGVFTILSGDVHAYVATLGRGNLFLGTLRQGEFFGEVGLMFDAISCTATIIAANETVCFYLDRIFYEAMYLTEIKIHYAMNCAILDSVSKRQRLMLDTILLSMQKSKIKVLELCKKNRETEGGIVRKSLRKEVAIYCKEFNEIDQHQVLLKNAKVVKVAYNMDITQILTGFCYIILNGALQVRVNDKTRSAKVVVFGPNVIFFPYTSIDKGKELFNYRTSGPIELIEISNMQVDFIQQNHVNTWYQLHDVMTHYLVSMQKLLNTLMLRLSIEKYECINIIE